MDQRIEVEQEQNSNTFSGKEHSNQQHSMDLYVVRRSGAVVPFDAEKIALAITKAYIAVNGQAVGASAKTRDLIRQMTKSVVLALARHRPTGGSIHIEEIQDQVELVLMRAGEHHVARSYVLYREKRHQERLQEVAAHPQANVVPAPQAIQVVYQGAEKTVSYDTIKQLILLACADLPSVGVDVIFNEAIKNIYNGVSQEDLHKALILSSRANIERDPEYAKVTARLLLHTLRLEALGQETSHADMVNGRYREAFPQFIQHGVDVGLLDSKLLQFDLQVLAGALVGERDLQFDYLGLQTLYDRYFLHDNGRRFELPQMFFMRVAMGLAISEIEREARAIEFYNLLSQFDFMSSTPTLFNAGTVRPQLSSCYLTTVADDLDGIYEAIKENALLAKFAGGLGNDWTPVRAMGSQIKGTNGKSQGVVPFLKVVNDTAVAVNQGGKRKGAVCCYLETWHLDIEEFLELRKNTGDDRRRTHDMNTANWIPDLFMRRVLEDGAWTLFSPDECKDLHDLYGQAFELAYLEYEEKAAKGEMRLSKTIRAVDLWRKMLSMLFETGHPWITFKDPCNIRSPQQHVGVVHSSNLCTEITLNTNDREIAVCNLGSVNLRAHLKRGVDGRLGIDHQKLQSTVQTAMRMLDNVVDINYYSVNKARQSNLKHRPVGLGIMAFQDCLYEMGFAYASQAAVDFADQSMEAVCYYAYWASTELAKERGVYNSFKGSLWDKGILPKDTLSMLAEQRRGLVEVDLSETLDWDSLRERIARYGMRNSNCVAIAPTATISNIIGVSASIEPTYQNLYVKSNLSGEFTVINEYLVRDLKRLNLWDEVMAADLKYFDGSLHEIDRIPEEIRSLYATAFEIESVWLVEAAARRQKWIDQAQSLNIYMSGTSGKKMDATYKLAWLRGLKTTYYFRSMGATHAEKSTVEQGRLNAVPVQGGVGGAQGPSPDPSSVASVASGEIKQLNAELAGVSIKSSSIQDLSSVDEGVACYYRPGDPEFEACEACQ
jgi:ribonucleoside-diphosphate reductase alpha chain